jgi:hypothetical protein
MNIATILGLWAAVSASAGTGLPFRFTWSSGGRRFVAEGTVTVERRKDAGK